MKDKCSLRCASRPRQVISLCEKKRDPPLQYVVADTPGQIEIFTWSASGAAQARQPAFDAPPSVCFQLACHASSCHSHVQCMLYA